MTKIIIQQNPLLQEQLEAPEKISSAWNEFVKHYKELHQTLDLLITIPLDGPFVNAYLEAREQIYIHKDASLTSFEWSEPKYNDWTGEEILSYGIKSVRENEQRYLSRLFDKSKGRISGTFVLTEKAFFESVAPPDVYELTKAFWPVVVHIEQLRRKDAIEFLQYLWVTDGNLEVDSAFAEKLTNELTLFADDEQGRYYSVVRKLLSELERLDKEFNVPGLSMSTKDYRFDPLQLKRLKANANEPEKIDDSGLMDTGVDEFGRLKPRKIVIY